MQGQGVNMAINDAYCLGQGLIRAFEGAKQGESQGELIAKALADYDSAKRRSEVRAVQERARAMTAWTVSSRFWVTSLLRMVMAYLPLGWIVAEAVQADTANRNALSANDIRRPRNPGTAKKP